MPTAIETLGEQFNFGGWNLGMGMIGTFIMWVILSMIVCGILGFIFYLWISRRTYSQKIRVLGMMGNTAMLKWIDTAKILPIGRAGDRLFLLRKRKRFIPPPVIQTGIKEWHFWEREDGELINIGYENLDEKMKKMNLKFVDADMRMQRLGIEKNLQFRLQKQGFWDKYGQTIVNAAFYVLVTMMLIVLFVQFGKMGATMNQAMETAERVLNEFDGEVSPNVPSEGEGSGVIPALILLSIRRFKNAIRS